MLDKRVEMFLEVAQSGSLAKAARNQFLSTVSVKKQMDSLEREVGTRLLDRTSRGVELTAAGKEFFEGAQRIAFMAERTLNRTRNAGSGSAQSLRLGTSVLRPCTQAIDLWEAAGDDKPDLTIEIVPFNDDTSSLNAVVEDLGKRIDCFIAPCDSVHWAQIANILLVDRLPFCLAVPRNHPLASKSVLGWNDLAGETIMAVSGTDSPIAASIRNEIKQNHPEITLDTTLTHYDLATFNKCEQSGYLLLTYQVWAVAHPRLVTIPTDWPYRMPYGIVYAKNPSPAMKTFAETIEKSLQS